MLVDQSELWGFEFTYWRLQAKTKYLTAWCLFDLSAGWKTLLAKFVVLILDFTANKLYVS